MVLGRARAVAYYGPSVVLVDSFVLVYSVDERSVVRVVRHLGRSELPDVDRVLVCQLGVGLRERIHHTADVSDVSLVVSEHGQPGVPLCDDVVHVEVDVQPEVLLQHRPVFVHPLGRAPQPLLLTAPSAEVERHLRGTEPELQQSELPGNFL